MMRSYCAVVAASWLLISGVNAKESCGGFIASGSLSGPNDVATVLSFALTVDSKVRVRTMTYAGGSVLYREGADPTGAKEVRKQDFQRGGFDPITGIREQGGDYILVNDDGPNAPVDPKTGVAYDSEIEGDLEAGKAYEVTISQYSNFPPGFGGSGFEGFEDVTGDSRTSKYGVVRITLSDLVSNAITINPSSLTGTSSSMIADYTVPIPAIGSNVASNIGLTLSEAAGFGYFDHFNWFQEIESLENGDFHRGPGIDPLPGGNLPILDPADDFIWYWDEEDVFRPFAEGDYSVEGNTGDITLGFEDSPMNWDVGATGVFVTYLAGVKSNKSDGMVFGSGFANTAFRWRYTQLSDGGGTVQTFQDGTTSQMGAVEFLGFLKEEDWDAERLARLNGYGITVAAQLQTSPVPEPSSLALLGIGGLSLLGWRRRRKPE
ncbi:DVUA0089 family protein [Maioricimonas sp. JC845]|uniref:DVUA0089 family protein n=1 Tax=Maioricimonas sp. JC845 TaxID=3232138 RepID=UPI003459176C